MPRTKRPFLMFLTTIIAFIFCYYFDLLLHEWSHGTVAWILGQKSSPFNIFYGGWLLLHVDENVAYGHLIATHQGTTAALIGIAGLTTTVILAILSFILMSKEKIQKNPIIFSFCYWSLIINMVPIYQYIPVSTFSSEGDVGRFIHGLNISPFWVFIPGTILVFAALWRILKIEVPKAYNVIPIESIFIRRIFLLATLGTIFLLIYTHGYNPFSDSSNPLIGKILACLSFLLIPILFFAFNPSHTKKN